MPEPLTAKSGLTRTATRGRRRELLAGAHEALQPRSRDSTSTVTPAATARRSSASVLPGPAKLIAVGCLPGVERDLHLAGGGDVELVDQAREVLDDGRHRVRLDRVAERTRSGSAAFTAATRSVIIARS